MQAVCVRRPDIRSLAGWHNRPAGRHHRPPAHGKKLILPFPATSGKTATMLASPKAPRLHGSTAPRLHGSTAPRLSWRDLSVSGRVQALSPAPRRVFPASSSPRCDDCHAHGDDRSARSEASPVHLRAEMCVRQGLPRTGRALPRPWRRLPRTWRSLQRAWRSFPRTRSGLKCAHFSLPTHIWTLKCAWQPSLGPVGRLCQTARFRAEHPANQVVWHGRPASSDPVL